MEKQNELYSDQNHLETFLPNLNTLEINNTDLNYTAVKRLQKNNRVNSKNADTTSRKKLKKAFIAFLTSPWCYGVSKLINNRKFYKLMWIIFITISTIICFIYIKSSILSYLKYYVITETHIKYDTDMDFPEITLCKDNNVLKNEFKVQRCLFDWIDCTGNFDTVSVFDDFGRERECLRFNGGKNYLGQPVPKLKQTRETSIFNGLKLIVEHYSNELNMVYISEKERASYYSADQLIKHKESASIVLNKFNSYKLGEPYNECVKHVNLLEGDLIQRTVKFNYKYSREKCNYLCFFKTTANKYNCSFPGIYEFNDTNNITKNSTVLCANIMSKKKISKEFNVFNASLECPGECPFECDSTHYEFKVNHDYDNFEMTNDSFKLFVYFKNLKYSNLEQIPKTQFPDLVAQIGGTLGKQNKIFANLFKKIN